jgi:hypothetical protein
MLMTATGRLSIISNAVVPLVGTIETLRRVKAIADEGIGSALNISDKPQTGRAAEGAQFPCGLEGQHANENWR